MRECKEHKSCDFNINQDLNRQDLNKILKNLYSTNFFEDVK